MRRIRLVGTALLVVVVAAASLAQDVVRVVGLDGWA